MATVFEPPEDALNWGVRTMNPELRHKRPHLRFRMAKTEKERAAKVEAHVSKSRREHKGRGAFNEDECRREFSKSKEIHGRTGPALLDEIVVCRGDSVADSLHGIAITQASNLVSQCVKHVGVQHKKKVHQFIRNHKKWKHLLYIFSKVLNLNTDGSKSKKRTEGQVCACTRNSCIW